jgi:hypothetical protein
MRRLRVRFLQVGVAVALLLGLTAAVSTSAWAYLATGSVTCVQVIGAVKFSPALSPTGTASHEHIFLKAKVGSSSCTPTGSNASLVEKMMLVVRWTVTATDANQCAQATPAAGAVAISPFKIVWRGFPHTPSPTTFTNTGENWVTGGSPTLTLPASADVGSFAGTQRTIGFTLLSDPCTGIVHSSGISGFTGGSVTLG